MNKFYVTTPIYYVNDVPHIGHGYTTIAADALARYHRLLGEDVFFLTGTDEHGAKVAESAKKAGKTPIEFCDEVAGKFEQVWERLGIGYDRFIRTTAEFHVAAVSRFLTELNERGYIYKGVYTGLYCVGCERFYARNELVACKCPLHLVEPEEVSEETYFFKLSEFQGRLLEAIKTDVLTIDPPERKNEIVSFLEGEELKDLAISRSKVEWGVRIPWDTTHTAYVWVDALLNYVTGVGWPDETKTYGRYWPANVQLMAKDILRIHATIWPAMLLALDMPLPRRLFIHGYFTVNGQKMSKSLGNVIDPLALAKTYSGDGVRYFILREFSFGRDGDFSLGRLHERYNKDLANDLGNLASRVLAMAEKYHGGLVPEAGRAQESDEELRNVVTGAFPELARLLARVSFNEALATVWVAVNQVNRYVDVTAPWALAKAGDTERLATVIYDALEALRLIALLIYPFMPETAHELWMQLGQTSMLEGTPLGEAAVWGKLMPKTQVKKGKALFPRLEGLQ